MEKDGFHPHTTNDSAIHASDVHSEMKKLKKRKSHGGIIEVHHSTPMGEKHLTQYLKSPHWNKLPEHQKELLLDTLGLENAYSRKQIAMLPHDKLTNYWKNKLSEHGVSA